MYKLLPVAFVQFLLGVVGHFFDHPQRGENFGLAFCAFFLLGQPLLDAGHQLNSVKLLYRDLSHWSAVHIGRRVCCPDDILPSGLVFQENRQDQPENRFGKVN